MRNTMFEQAPRTVGVALLALSFGCGGKPAGEAREAVDGAENQNAPDAATPERESFEGRVLRCGKIEGQTGSSEESTWYAVDHMTRKLWRYPSLAKHAGLSSVSSCEEAQAYVRAYRAYSHDHPRFETLPDPLESADGSKDGKKPILPRLKIDRGQRVTETSFPNNTSPIVHIEPASWKDDGTGKYYTDFCQKTYSCTGVFIARNWILTAAHCLQPAHLQAIEDPTLASCPDDGLQPSSDRRADFEGVAGWIVKYAGASGADRDHSYVPTIAFSAQQMPFYGYNGSNEDQGDLGLLYIRPGRDGDLPSDPSAGAAALIGADRLPEPLPANWKLKIAGFGGSKNSEASQPLNEATAIALHSDPNNFELHAEVNTDSDPIPCHGDSGGPLYRWIKDANEKDLLVLYGINSRFMRDPNVPERVCPIVGEENIWTRLDMGPYIRWINDRKLIWQDAPCRKAEYPDPDDGTKIVNVYACWGLPCKTSTDCKNAAMVCAHPERPGVDCAVCCRGCTCLNEPNCACKEACETCSCIVGQCVHRGRVEP